MSMSAKVRRRSRNKLRRRLFPTRSVEPGESPGILTAPPGAQKPVIRVMAYGPELIDEVEVDSPEKVRPYLESHPVAWVNVDGLGDPSVLETLGEIFGVHRLTLEDVMNVHQRPKVEEFEDNLYIVTRMSRSPDSSETEQLSLVLGKKFLLTVQERSGDSFDRVRNRIRQGRSRIRESGSDYLAYAILDAVVDAYFPLLEGYGDRLTDLEDEILSRPEEVAISQLHLIRRDLMTLRKICWPLHEVLGRVQHEDLPLITVNTRLFLRDCHDHAIQLVDLADAYRDFSGSLMDLHLSYMSHKMNEVMKVLTIMASVFIPLTFIAGIYGMNFDPGVSKWNMPELGWSFGYPAALGVMAVIGVLMLLYFRRKGWIGGGPRKR